jgi:isoleucyl-tRNA synthetase
MTINFSEIEKKNLKFWQKNKIFEKSIFQRKNCPIFSFYDGPPFATGLPHYGHILATTIKDTILRYWTMRGYQVPRRVGWDCHGLPIENLIEKELRIKNKKEIEKLGIEKFNQFCRDSVFHCVKDFEETLKRVGRWADYKTAYATLDSDYIESVWWVLKQLWELNLVYKDYRVAPYCPRCGTVLSNFEVNQGYKEITEPAIYVKFQILNYKFQTNSKLAKTYFLVWTTTPWTLPGNVALAVQSTADYFLIEQGNENYILSKKRLNILVGKYRIIKKFSGKDLIGLKYEPLFDSLVKQNVKNINNAFQVLPADFVSIEEGTGIVHIATMYGDDDFQLGKKFNLPIHHTIDEEGFFKKEVNQWADQFIKKADLEIIEDLNKRGLLYKKENTLHSYPFCWRCDNPLIYYALESWYIAVTKIKKELISNNKKIHWVPNHIKEGRFGRWLAGVKDWAFSRNRFWGASIPIWRCQNCNNFKVIGSIKELEKLSKKKVKDLHRPYIDEITFKCEKCERGEMKRISEVFDCWFESGSMPYAQWHYPFENKKLVEKTFPADFIAEGLDQTRGWFYTLHVIATALTLKNIGLGKNQPAFKNVIVNGLILAEDGKKLSKRLQNYTPPEIIFDKFGADTLRYFLLTSTQIGEDYYLSDRQVEEVYRQVISTIWHTFLFFQTYVEKNFRPIQNFQSKNLLDRWIISRVNNLTQKITEAMNAYELTIGARSFNNFIDDLSNWYVRRSRRRFQKPEDKKEKEEAFQTLYNLLLNLSKLTAPFIPFISEEIYQSLRLKSKIIFSLSVHLEDWPKVNKKLIDKKLEKKMEEARRVVVEALAQRAKAGIKVRQPLSELRITNYELRKEKELLNLIIEEVNIKKIVFGKTFKLDTKITPELKEEGMTREVIRQIQEMRKEVGLKPKDKILIRYFGDLELNKILEKNKKFILMETKAKNFFLNEKPIGQEKTINQQKLWLAIEKL